MHTLIFKNYSTNANLQVYLYTSLSSDSSVLYLWCWGTFSTVMGTAASLPPLHKCLAAQTSGREKPQCGKENTTAEQWNYWNEVVPAANFWSFPNLLLQPGDCWAKESKEGFCWGRAGQRSGPDECCWGNRVRCGGRGICHLRAHCDSMLCRAGGTLTAKAAALPFQPEEMHSAAAKIQWQIRGGRG